MVDVARYRSGASFALFQRFVILPMMDGPARSIWLLPLSLVFFLPTIHRLVIPSRFSDLYTGGNWFSTGMLFLFTWLAASVAAINPPLGDIAAPEVPEGIGIADTEDVASVEYNGKDLILSVADGSLDITIGFSVRDNWNGGHPHERNDPEIRGCRGGAWCGCWIANRQHCRIRGTWR